MDLVFLAEDATESQLAYEASVRAPRDAVEEVACEDQRLVIGARAIVSESHRMKLLPQHSNYLRPRGKQVTNAQPSEGREGSQKCC